MRRFFIGFIGCMLIFLGVTTFIVPETYFSVYSVYADLSDVKWPFLIFTVTFGSICLYVSLFKKGTKFCYWICSNCEGITYLSLDNEGEEAHLCDSCGVRLEQLKGFYDRHPVLKNRK